MIFAPPSLKDERTFLQSLGGMTYSKMVEAYFNQYHIAVTRSAIAGKMTRMKAQLSRVGLEVTPSEYRTRPLSQTANACRQRRRKSRSQGGESSLVKMARAAQRAAPVVAPPPLAPLLDYSGLQSLRLPLWEIPDKGCRYVCGTDERGTALFCGLPGYPFCADHKLGLYVKTPRQLAAEERRLQNKLKLLL